MRSFRTPISDSAKGWTGIIAGVAALLTAVGAITREPDETAARGSYEVLSAQIEQLAEVQKQQSADLKKQAEWAASLRGYLNGLQDRAPDRDLAPRGRRGPPPAPRPTSVTVLPPPPKPTARPVEPSLPTFEQIENRDQ